MASSASARPLTSGHDVLGAHRLDRDERGPVYLAHGVVGGRLPRLALIPRVDDALAAAPLVIGPRQRLGRAVLDAVFVATSDGREFPAALCAEDERVRWSLARMADDVVRIEIARVDGGARVDLRTRRARDKHDLAESIELARAVLLRARALTTRRFDEVGPEGDDAPTPARIAALVGRVAAATASAAGQAARVGDAVEARVILDVADLAGALRVAWREPAIARVDVSLTVALPAVDAGALSLSPERGLAARIRAWSEQELDDPALDAAALVEGDVRARPAIDAARDAVLALVAADGRVVVDATSLRVAVERLRVGALEPFVADALLLWRRAALARTGAS